MKAFTETTLTARVRDQISDTASLRLAKVAELALHHLHAFVREARPTEAEWLSAIRFLTTTGQVSTDQRNDFILMSDLFGVSALVDLVNHTAPDADATESTVLGPFFVEGAPALEPGSIVADLTTGEPTVVEGRVLNATGAPVPAARVDVWQTDGTGEYDVQHDQPGDSTRGQFRSGADGGFWFRTVKPVSYPVPTDGPVGALHKALGRPVMRPAHLHFMIRAEGYRSLTTHLFVEGDPHLPSDPVFGVKPSLIVPFAQRNDPTDAARWDVPAPFFHVRHDFRLVRLNP
jgi:protocatechuate 3,4-dioxygenase beta subunit